MQRYNSSVVLFAISFFMTVHRYVEAAPIPLTSSSKLMTERPGVYRSPFGFSIDTSGTNWSLLAEDKASPHIVAAYKNSTGRAGLSIRVDELKKPLSLDEYSKQWLKDYPRFGFDILSSKKVKLGQEVVYSIDLHSQETDKKIRQVLLVKNNKAVTLTCRSDADEFKNNLKDCNTLIRNFRWP